MVDLLLMAVLLPEELLTPLLEKEVVVVSAPARLLLLRGDLALVLRVASLASPMAQQVPVHSVALAAQLKLVSLAMLKLGDTLRLFHSRHRAQAEIAVGGEERHYQYQFS